MPDAATATGEGELGAILDVISSQDKFVITSHVAPDGDCISSLLAFRRLLMRLGKTCCITYSHPVPEKYAFLPDSTAISEKRPKFKPQALAVLDTADTERVALEKSFLESVSLTLNVDHHPSNTGFGTWRFVDENVCATCAIIYRMYHGLQVSIDSDAASQLLCGIMTDTGRLSFSNADAEAFHICADLVEKGASADHIARQVYFQEDFLVARTRGRVLSTMELSAGGKICSMVLSEDVAKWGKDSGPGDTSLDTEGLVDYAVRIRGVEIGMLLRWIGKDMVKVSFRSAGVADVNDLAQLFGGGGHRKAAGCTLAGRISDVKSRVLAEAERCLRK